MGDGTQYTVNNQMVNATLMNIADAPTNVQLPGVYKTEEVRTTSPYLCIRGRSCLRRHCGVVGAPSSATAASGECAQAVASSCTCSGRCKLKVHNSAHCLLVLPLLILVVVPHADPACADRVHG